MNERGQEILNKGRLLWRILKNDTRNICRYGSSAPLWGERIWVDPSRCDRVVAHFKQECTGVVLGGDWDIETADTKEYPMVRYSLLHWKCGIPWEDTGAYENLEGRIRQSGGPRDGCLTTQDIILRYKELDKIFNQVKTEGRLRTRNELRIKIIREYGGVYIHVGRNGNTLFGARGCHRMAIAMALELPLIPAQVGVVHSRAMPAWRRSLKLQK